MTPDNLLDAIGLLDDCYLETRPRHLRWSRGLTVLAAAILALALSVGTAMAVSPEFRELVFSIFTIQTPERPPAGYTEPPTGSGLQELDVVEIDGVVQAHYFTSDGLVLTCDGGFYTCARDQEIPSDAAFWEIRPDGIVNIGANRTDFSFTHAGRTLQITFDWAILHGKLAIRCWPRNLGEDPLGNGWNAEPIGSRTDMVLLTVPVYTDAGYTHDFFLLDMKTLEVTDLLAGIPREGLLLDACYLSGDLRYGLLPSLYHGGGYWLLDREGNTLSDLTALTGREAMYACFLNDDTLMIREALEDGNINILRFHIPTGEQTVLVENAAPGDYWGIGTHGLLLGAEGQAELLNLSTGTRLALTGLDTAGLQFSESPGGTRILIARDAGSPDSGFSQLGMLDPRTGVLQMLTREVSGNLEYLLGWLNESTVVISARDESGNYYVYLYGFIKN